MIFVASGLFKRMATRSGKRVARLVRISQSREDRVEHVGHRQSQGALLLLREVPDDRGDVAPAKGAG